MWAALFGLMLVCSTIVLGPLAGGVVAGSPLDGDPKEGLAVQEGVDVTGAGDLDTRDAPAGSERLDDRLGQLPWRSPGDAGQLEAERGGQVAHLRVGRVGEGDRLRVDPQGRLGRRAKGGLKDLFRADRFHDGYLSLPEEATLPPLGGEVVRIGWEEARRAARFSAGRLRSGQEATGRRVPVA